VEPQSIASIALGFGLGAVAAGVAVWAALHWTKGPEECAEAKVRAWIYRRNIHVSKLAAANKSAMAAFDQYYTDGRSIAIAITLNGCAQTLGRSKLMLGGVDYERIASEWRSLVCIDPHRSEAPPERSKIGALRINQVGIMLLAERLCASDQVVMENKIGEGKVAVTLTHALSSQEVENFFQEYESSLRPGLTA